MAEQEYLLANEWHRARERLAALERMKDPDTISNLERIGVSAGWRCLEVGGGGGSIAEWFCKKVGPTGHVVATDMDTRFLEAIEAPNLEVRNHDITSDDLEVGSYDVVHARAVLIHIQGWRYALTKMTDALKPGGWLVLEESDFIDYICDPSTDEPERIKLDRFFDTFRATLTQLGYDMRFGTNALKYFKDNGLDMLSSEGKTYAFLGGSPTAEFYQITMEQLRERFLSIGMITNEEIDEFIELSRKPTIAFRNMKSVVTWGRKPT